jgi:hypothetical protein
MRAIIINKLLSLLKACIFSGLALMCLTANAEGTPEYAAVPAVDDCHYAKHPIIRKTVHQKARHVKHHHAHAHRKPNFANDLSVYYPFSAPSYYDNMWPSEGCPCAESNYAVSALSSDEFAYNLITYNPLYENGVEAAPCDLNSEE